MPDSKCPFVDGWPKDANGKPVRPGDKVKCVSDDLADLYDNNGTHDFDRSYFTVDTVSVEVGNSPEMEAISRFLLRTWAGVLLMTDLNVGKFFLGSDIVKVEE